jgi:lysophospholipase L1-like esterase
LDATTTANTLYGIVNGATTWNGWVTGTDLYMTASSGSGTVAALLEVSIDDGLWFTPSYLSSMPGFYTIFTGKPHSQYQVCIRFKGSAFNPKWMTNTSTEANPLFIVDGAYSPSIVPVLTWVQCNDGNALTAWSSCNVAATGGGGTNYVPAYLPGSISLVSGTAIPSVKFKTNATRMVVINPDPYVFVSIDGAAYTRYKCSLATQVYHTTHIPLDGATHTYNVWQSSARGTFNVFAVGLDAAVVDCGTKRRMDQYGSSTTAGAGVGASNSDGQVDTMSVASALGLVGSTYGISGENIAGFVARMTALLAAKTVASTDVCILQLGANDIGVLDATAQTNITNIITAMLTKGYGKIIVRGNLTVLGEAGSTTTLKTADNITIGNLVTAYGNANVRFVNPIALAWGVVDSPDATHPSVVGYQTITPLEVTAYSPLI